MFSHRTRFLFGRSVFLRQELVYQGCDIVSIASNLCVNVNLVAIKLAATKFDDVMVPFVPKQNFLGKIEDSYHD